MKIVWGFGFRVQGLGFRAWGLGLRGIQVAGTGDLETIVPSKQRLQPGFPSTTISSSSSSLSLATRGAP